MFFFFAGLVILALVLGLFWMKDALQNLILARIAYSGLVARLAVVGAAFVVIGLLLMLADLAKNWSG